LVKTPNTVCSGQGFTAADVRREPAELSLGEGVLPVPPLPLKPTVGTLLAQ